MLCLLSLSVANEAIYGYFVADGRYILLERGLPKAWGVRELAKRADERSKHSTKYEVIECFEKVRCGGRMEEVTTLENRRKR